MVGHPGAAPGISRSQAERISYLPRARGKWWPWRFRRDSHPLVTRLTTVRLDDFGFGTHVVGMGKWWELVVMLHRSASGSFFDGRFTVG